MKVSKLMIFPLILLGLSVFAIFMAESAEIKEEPGMALGIYDRITLKSILPPRGNFTSAVIIKDIRVKLNLTQDEIKEYEVAPGPNQVVQWSKAGIDYKITVIFTELELEVLKDALSKLVREQKIPTEERFIE